MKGIISIILIFCTITLSAVEKIPEPYLDEEFSPILLDIRRASIIFCGAFPLGYMYSSIIGDPIINESSMLNGLDGVEKSNKQIEIKLVSSLIFSGVIMILDFIIEKFFRR